MVRASDHEVRLVLQEVQVDHGAIVALVLQVLSVLDSCSLHVAFPLDLCNLVGSLTELVHVRFAVAAESTFQVLMVEGIEFRNRLVLHVVLSVDSSFE